MPAAWTKTASIVHSVPVVQTAIFVQRLRRIACVDVRRAIVATSIFSVHSHGSRCRVLPFRVAEVRGNRIAVPVILVAEIFSKPALLPDEHRGVVVALVRDRIAATPQGIGNVCVAGTVSGLAIDAKET